MRYVSSLISPLSTPSEVSTLICRQCCSSDSEDDDGVQANFHLLRQKTGLVKLYELIRRADQMNMAGITSFWRSYTVSMKVRCLNKNHSFNANVWNSGIASRKNVMT